MALAAGRGEAGSVKVAAGAASAVGAERRTLTGSDRFCHKAA